MAEEDGGDEDSERLQNFVDLARVNAALLVPAFAAAVMTTGILKAMYEIYGRKEEGTKRRFRVVAVGVFLTTLLDSGNAVSAMTLESESTAGRLQIVGSFMHGLFSFFWRLFGMEIIGTPPQNGQPNIHIGLVIISSILLGVGEVLETTAIMLTLSSKYFVPALCLVSMTPCLACIWIGIVTNEDPITMEKLRRPVVLTSEVLYIGIVTIATIQNWENIFLLFPEVPLDLIEHCAIASILGGGSKEENVQQ